MLSPGVLLGTLDFRIEVFDSAVDERYLIGSILRYALKRVPFAEVDIQGSEPSFHEDSAKDANRNFLLGFAAGLDVLEQHATLPECGIIVIAMDGCACLVVQDGEGAATKCSVDFGKQPARVLRLASQPSAPLAASLSSWLGL
jgi:hypothetical protein